MLRFIGNEYPCIAIFTSCSLCRSPACSWAAPTAADTVEKTIKGFGVVIDPDGDCQIKEEHGKLTIAIPDTHDDLAYTADFTKLNSPRVLQDVKGDFRLQARIDAFEPPGNKAASAGKYSWLSSGLLIWRNEKNFIRVERAGSGNSLFLWIEQFLDGKAAYQKQSATGEKGTYLRAREKAIPSLSSRAMTARRGTTSTPSTPNRPSN